MAPVPLATVVHVDASQFTEQVHDYLANAGEISRLYPWRLDRSNREHYFVVYASEAEAAGAIALSTNDVIVKPLARAPQQLLDIFNAVARGPFGDRPPTTTSSADLTPRYTTPSPTSPSSSHSNSASPLTPTGHPRESAENGQRAAKRVKLLKHAMHTDLAFDSLYAPSPSTSIPGPSGLPYISLSTRRQTGKQIDGGGGLDRGRSRTPPPALLSPPPSPIPVNLGSSAANSNGRPHSSSSSFIPSGAPPMRASLVMPLCGQSISIDLDSLDEDPQAVISLLKAAEADRDKWMLVGGAYRRKGNLNAAISVVNRMLEGILPTRLISSPLSVVFQHHSLTLLSSVLCTVMKEASIAEEQLRPAFLMLSSCLTELGKQARLPNGRETAESNACFEQSRYWLQKVYGALKPELAMAQQQQQASSGRPRAISNSTTSNGASSRSFPVSTPTTSVSSSSLPSSEQRALERELMVLRDRHSSFISELTEARTAKRKTEDECSHERTLRRRAEARIDELERQLSKADKRMDSAVEQVKREVEARRKAEDTAEAERKARVETERTAETRAEATVVKPAFEEMAGFFAKVARGELSMGAIAELANGRRNVPGL
ncbi:uncharacterized protein STEHIDRAFT_163921 [Stereum hirsutum FP-91666 SS1]|uniref:Uncharacterized protein n=1 Tax=Stereum hirsutum (strain FP-91666) TaxID=721885 RepID=R7RVN7_STEHR|nr:uncharacterized protein STEHIDRAFT_163921 [Stereum hirsutum FP-91666 SS1]EIM79159.1 hypothetical protein STEHIDRAFT_163921 [Stereum hirsutum FP-91666 SS1]